MAGPLRNEVGAPRIVLPPRPAARLSFPSAIKYTCREGRWRMSAKLDELFAYLDRLTGRAPLDELTALLRRLQPGCDDLAEHVRFADEGYRRNLVRAGRWYHLWVLCWKHGQRSPIHDH